MSSIRPSVAGALARAATRSTRVQATRQQFSTSGAARASHGSQYDPPTGWLFGVKPGEKYKPEGWENLFFYGFCGSLAVFAVAYAFKPDTSIQTWALEEARRRLEAEGILPDPDKKE
ncbi:hypothetical protein BR93DRAFT_940017 [Coniochaeta sp. PMI_546]|nr:hypothetical protein BR93DRAFT_940017 [Coniochaeta sp. PMI_546]